MVELKSDMFKLAVVYQRPISHRVSSIGIWGQLLQIIMSISVLTNAAWSEPHWNLAHLAHIPAFSHFWNTMLATDTVSPIHSFGMETAIKRSRMNG